MENVVNWQENTVLATRNNLSVDLIIKYPEPIYFSIENYKFSEFGNESIY